MKKPKIPILYIVLIISAIVIFVSVSAVMAYMLRESSDITNVFVPANVDCEVIEIFEDNKKTSIKVENKSNIKTYIRLRVVAYWQDSKGNIVVREEGGPEIEFGTKWTYDTEKWFYDAAEKTFYYKSAVNVGASTSELLKLGGTFDGIQLNAVTKDVNGVDFTYHPVITFIAEAVQAEPNGAVTYAWGVDVDSNGNLKQS
ncbi:MAG: hypothetical protein IKT37_04080 [Clostridia bacterium]|nr:hypothetical protein [Clostridia bacterium]